MGYRILADCVVALHLFFILFVVLGGLCSLGRRWAIWFHLPAVFWAVGLELFGWGCPLTPLENWLRRAGASQGYEGGFIEHYLLPILYPAGLTRSVQIALGCGAILANLLVYWLVLSRRVRRGS